LSALAKTVRRKLQTLETSSKKRGGKMRKGEMIFRPIKKCWQREPATAEGSDLLLAAGILCFVAAILIAVWWRFL